MNLVSKLKGRTAPCLIPSNKKQPERILLSVFMSAMEIVPSFRARILSEVGYASGKTAQYKSFMEVSFNDVKLPPKPLRPDGLVICERGKTVWSALFEAKARTTDKNKIRAEQIIEYAEIAHTLKIDTIVSISNEHALTPSDLPYSINKTKLKKRDVYHLSWLKILLIADLTFQNDKSLNVTEKKILSEVIEFMNTAGNGVETFDQMPDCWADFIKQTFAPHGLKKNTKDLKEIVHAWEQERRDLKLKLQREFGENVSLSFDRKAKANPKIRLEQDINTLVNENTLIAKYAFTNSKTIINAKANLYAKHIGIEAIIYPPEGKQAKGVATWLLKALSDCPLNDLKIDFDWPRDINDISTSLGELREIPEIASQKLKEAPRKIILSLEHNSVKDFNSRKKFILKLEELTQKLAILLSDAKLI